MAEETKIDDETGGKAAGDAGTEGTEGTAAEGTDDDTPVETLAKEMGWRPKENFNGDDTNFVDAESYIRKGQDIQDSMRKSLKDQKRQLSDMSVSLTELKQHNERVFKAEVGQLKKELSTLKAQKKTAIEDGDVAKVDEIDEQIDTVKESMSPPEKVAAQTPDSNDEFDGWIKDNNWYNDDKEMATYADTIADNHKGAPFARVAALVTNKVKEMFPDKFSVAKKNNVNVSRVEASGRRVTTSKFTKADLSDSQKDIMRQFVKQGIMSESEYIKDLATVAQGGAV